MTIALGLLTLLLHAALMAAAAPVLTGLLRWMRGRLLGRDGPPVLQPWRDLRRLARKQPVLPENASWLLAAAPMMSLTAVAAAALLVPSFALGMATAPAADLIVLAGLLTASRWAMALAGLESGTAAGGLGSSRSMSVAVLAEPALLLVVFALATMAGSTNLDFIAATLRDGASELRVSLGLALAAAVIVALAETGRLPVADAAATHDLAMAEQATWLAFSGWHLALAEAAGSLRLLVWLSLLAVLFLPAGIAPAGAGPVGWVVGLLAWAAKIGALSAALATFEAATASMRRSRVPEFLGIALLLGLLAALFLFVSQGFA